MGEEDNGGLGKFGMGKGEVESEVVMIDPKLSVCNGLGVNTAFPRDSRAFLK